MGTPAPSPSSMCMAATSSISGTRSVHWMWRGCLVRATVKVTSPVPPGDVQNVVALLDGGLAHHAGEPQLVGAEAGDGVEPLVLPRDGREDVAHAFAGKLGGGLKPGGGIDGHGWKLPYVARGSLALGCVRPSASFGPSIGHSPANRGRISLGGAPACYHGTLIEHAPHELGGPMLLCAQYILPVSSEPVIDGAVLVRDGVIRDHREGRAAAPALPRGGDRRSGAGRRHARSGRSAHPPRAVGAARRGQRCALREVAR